MMAKYTLEKALNKLEKLNERHVRKFHSKIKITEIGKKAGKICYSIVTDFANFSLSGTGMNDPQFIHTIIETVLSRWPRKEGQISKFFKFRFARKPRFKNHKPRIYKLKKVA